MKLQQFLKGRNLTSESKNESKQSKCDRQAIDEDRVVDKQLGTIKTASKLADAKPTIRRGRGCGKNLQDNRTASKLSKKSSLIPCVKPECKSEKVSLIKKNSPSESNEPEFKCTECQSVFIRKDALVAHLRVHSGQRPFLCVECDLTFARSYSLSIHLRKHSGEKPFKCSECAAVFSQSVHLQRHLRRHTGARPYKCSECGDCFRQTGGLQQHLRSHTGAKPYKCQFCDKAFSRSYSLRVHEFSHSDVKPFRCTVCGDRFTQRGNLQVHMRRHSGEKPHICLECGKAFAHSQSLQVHLRVHSGMRPYHCTVEGCKATFADSGSLYKHRLIHSNVMPHVCEFCNARFAQRANMKRHVRVMHGKVVGPPQRRSVAKVESNSSSAKFPKVKLQAKKQIVHVRVKLDKQSEKAPKHFKYSVSGDQFTHMENAKSYVNKHCKKNQQFSFPESSDVISESVSKEQENLPVMRHTSNNAELFRCTVCRDHFDTPICLHCLGREKEVVSKPSSETFPSLDKEPSRQVLAEHTNSESGLLKCMLCNNSFTHREDLQTHMCHNREQSFIPSKASNEILASTKYAEQGRRRKQKMPKKKIVE